MEDAEREKENKKAEEEKKEEENNKKVEEGEENNEKGEEEKVRTMKMRKRVKRSWGKRSQRSKREIRRKKS